MTVQYFIDSENVGDFWIPLLDLPAEKTELIVFYTRNSPHMSYESLIKLKESDRKVTFIKCYEGTNALDFQLVSELGFHICQDEDDRFVIVTNDTGFDAAVKYWRRKKKSVKRITGKECRNLERRIREDLQSGQMQERNTAASEIRYTVEDQDVEQAVQENELQDKQTLSAEDVRLSRPNLRDAERASLPEPDEEFPQEESAYLTEELSDNPDEELFDLDGDGSDEDEDVFETDQDPAPAAFLEDEAASQAISYDETDESDETSFLDEDTDEDYVDPEAAEEEPVENTDDQAAFEDALEEIPAGPEISEAYDGDQETPAASEQEHAEDPSVAETSAVEISAQVTSVKETSAAEPVESSSVPMIPDGEPVEKTAAPEISEDEHVKEQKSSEVSDQESEEAAEADPAVSSSSHRSKSRRSRSRRSKSGAKKQDSAAAAAESEDADSHASEKAAVDADTPAKAAADDSSVKPAGKQRAKAADPSGENSRQASAAPGDEEIARIVACIGQDNLAELHNQLATFYGDQGKDIYLSIKNNSRSFPVLKPDLSQKFAYYCEIIFSRSDDADEYPSDISEFLLNVREKLNNLNSLRYALQKHYGKEKGRRYYFLLKPYAKTMYQM